MKKTTRQKKKLELDKAVIRVLTPEQLRDPHGGYRPCTDTASGCSAGPE